jgi:hypothetical protein
LPVDNTLKQALMWTREQDGTGSFICRQPQMGVFESVSISFLLAICQKPWDSNDSQGFYEGKIKSAR